MSELMKEVDGPVVFLTLNRPDRRNALNRELSERVLSEMTAAAGDEAVRVIVLRGAGTAFCGGADVSELRTLSGSEALLARAELTAQLLQVVAGIDIPVLAAVNGPAVGAGAGLALSCDGIAMADDATLGFPELQHGIPPLLVLPGLQRHVGALAAFDVLTRGRPITSQEAMERRWISRVVPASQLQSEVRTWALSISELPRSAIVATKRLTRDTAHLSLSDALVGAVARYR